MMVGDALKQASTATEELKDQLQAELRNTQADLQQTAMHMRKAHEEALRAAEEKYLNAQV